jgi:hypothetical protein
MGIATIAQGSRITGQRHCYNLCESRVGSAASIAALRGYAFWVGLSVPREEVGDTVLAGSTTQRLPPKKAARMGDEGKGAGFRGRRLCCL